MARNDIKNSSLLKTKFLIYAFNGRTLFNGKRCAAWPLRNLKLLFLFLQTRPDFYVILAKKIGQKVGK